MPLLWPLALPSLLPVIGGDHSSGADLSVSAWHHIKMAALDLNRAWALFMSDPAYFVAIFVIVAGAVATFTWWLRHFIGKERIATLKERTYRD